MKALRRAAYGELSSKPQGRTYEGDFVRSILIDFKPRLGQTVKRTVDVMVGTRRTVNPEYRAYKKAKRALRR